MFVCAVCPCDGGAFNRLPLLLAAAILMSLYSWFGFSCSRAAAAGASSYRHSHRLIATVSSSVGRWLVGWSVSHSTVMGGERRASCSLSLSVGGWKAASGSADVDNRIVSWRRADYSEARLAAASERAH